jgi:hypothetical protein
MKSLVTEDGYNRQRSLVPGDYSYIDLEDILEEDDEGLGEQLGEGPGKLSLCPSFCIRYMTYFAVVSPTELVYCYYTLNN